MGEKYLNKNVLFQCGSGNAVWFRPQNGAPSVKINGVEALTEACSLGLAGSPCSGQCNLLRDPSTGTPGPCAAPVVAGVWNNNANLNISGSAALVDHCSISCPAGGTIKPFESTTKVLNVGSEAAASSTSLEKPDNGPKADTAGGRLDNSEKSNNESQTDESDSSSDDSKRPEPEGWIYKYVEETVEKDKRPGKDVGKDVAAKSKWKAIEEGERLDKNVQTFFIAHGNQNSVDTKWIGDMASAIRRHYPDANILAVSWPKLANRDLMTGADVAESAFYADEHVSRLVAYQLFGIVERRDAKEEKGDKGKKKNARIFSFRTVKTEKVPIPTTVPIPGFIASLVTIVSDDVKSYEFYSLGLNPENVHMIGHSHGAHIVGLVGRAVKKHKRKLIYRITTLDASNPLSHRRGKRNSKGRGWDRRSKTPEESNRRNKVASYVDNYRTSPLGSPIPYGDDNFMVYENDVNSGSVILLEVKKRKADANLYLSFIEKHSYAHKWFIGTINDKQKRENFPGFWWGKKSWSTYFSSIRSEDPWRGTVYGHEKFVPEKVDEKFLSDNIATDFLLWLESKLITSCGEVVPDFDEGDVIIHCEVENSPALLK